MKSDLATEAVRAALAGAIMPPERLDALAAALDGDPGILRTLLRRLGQDLVPRLPEGTEAVRLAWPLLRALHDQGAAGMQAARQFAKDIWCVSPAAAFPLFRRAGWLLEGEGAVPDGLGGVLATALSAEGLDRAGTLRALEHSYKAHLWLEAACAADMLGDALVTETNLQRMAEAAVAVGDWERALLLADRAVDLSRRMRFGLIRMRALVGLGEFSAAWSLARNLAVEERHPHVPPLAAAAVRCLGEHTALPDLLRMGGSPAATLRALLPLIEEISTTQGARDVRQALRLTAALPDLPLAVHAMLFRLRFRLDPSGWPTRLEARWAERLLHRATRVQVPAQAAIQALLATLRPWAAWGLLQDLDSSTAAPPDLPPALLIELARALAERGALLEPEALLHRSGLVDDALSKHLRTMRSLAAGNLPTQTRRPATRLLFHALPLPMPALTRNSGTPGRRLLLHFATGFSVGGTERQLQTVALGLAARHPDLDQVFVLARGGLANIFDRELHAQPGRFRFTVPEGLDQELGPAARPADMADFDGLAQRAARLPRIARLRQMIAELAPTAVMAWKPDAAALMAAAQADVPHILYRAASMPPALRPWPTEWQLTASDLAEEAFRRLAKIPAMRFVANSGAALTAFRAQMGWPAECSDVLYNAFDPTPFRSTLSQPAARASLGLPSEGPVVAGCFRLSPEKRPMLWLGAAEAFLASWSGPPVTFVLAGGGPMFGQMSKAVAARGLTERVRLLGQMTGGLADFYRAADILLHSSAVEGLPNALVEAQSNGLPVVANVAGGAGDAFLPGVTGELVPGADPLTLAEALARSVHRLPQSRAQRAVFEAFVAERFGLARCLDRLDSLLGLNHGPMPREQPSRHIIS